MVSEQPAPGWTEAVSTRARPAVVRVDEPQLSSRVRRPGDAIRLLVAVLLIVIIVGLGTLAVGTAGALERDLSVAINGLPRVLLTIVGYAGGIGVLMIGLLFVIDMVHRGIVSGIVLGFSAAAAGAAVASGFEWLISNDHFSDEVAIVLTRPLASGGRTPPLSELIVATVALLTAGSASRRLIWPFGVLVVGSSMLTGVLGGTATAMAMTCSLLMGWIVGLIPRLAVGVPSSRPSGTTVASALTRAGVGVSHLTYSGSGQYGRHYRADTTRGHHLDVEVFDVDAFSTWSARLFIRRLRLRGPLARRPSLSVRAGVEHRTLVALSLERAGIAAPSPDAVCAAGAGSAVVAWRNPSGTRLDELPAPLTEEQLTALFELAADLRRAGIAHRGLNVHDILFDDRGRAVLADLGHGDIAAADLALRLDLAQLLVTGALASDAERTVRVATDVLGREAVVNALPLLQPVGLDVTTRAALRQRKETLGELQKAVGDLAPQQDLPEPVELRRVTPRGVITVAGGAVAAYVLLGQLSGADIGQVLRGANWTWASLIPIFVVLTFAGASLVLSGAVLTPLRFRLTYMVQLAVAFSGLVAPALVGNIALNTRYLQRSGVSPAVAASSIGLGQVAQFSSYATLFVLSGVAAGVGPRASFNPPGIAILGLALAILVIIGLISVPAVRRFASRRLLGHLKGVVPSLLGVLQRPSKIAQLIGGALLLDASFVTALYLSTRAFGATTPLAAVAVTYFAGAVIGSAVPTPGGLGGVEAALAAGLVAVGTSSGVAVSAVLLYRLATYWAPIPLGWVSIHYLQRIRAL